MDDRSVTVKRMGRNAEQNAAARESAQRRIVAAALELIAARGFTGTSMSAVAGRAGVSKSLVFRYFDTKEALAQAVVSERVADLTRLGAGLEAAEPAARLRAFAHGMADRVEAEPTRFALYLRVLSDPELRALAGPLAPDRGAWVALFADLGASEPELEARFFQVALLGILTHRALSPTPVPVRPLVDRLLATVLPRET